MMRMRIAPRELHAIRGASDRQAMAARRICLGALSVCRSRAFARRGGRFLVDGAEDGYPGGAREIRRVSMADHGWRPGDDDRKVWRAAAPAGRSPQSVPWLSSMAWMGKGIPCCNRV